MSLLLSEIPVVKLGKSGYFWPTPGDPAMIYSHIAELQHIKLQELTSKFDALAVVVQSQQFKHLSQEAALQTQKNQLALSF